MTNDAYFCTWAFNRTRMCCLAATGQFNKLFGSYVLKYFSQPADLSELLQPPNSLGLDLMGPAKFLFILRCRAEVSVSCENSEPWMY